MQFDFIHIMMFVIDMCIHCLNLIVISHELSLLIMVLNCGCGRCSVYDI